MYRHTSIGGESSFLETELYKKWRVQYFWFQNYVWSNFHNPEKVSLFFQGICNAYRKENI